MEAFGARPEQALDVCVAEVRTVDVVVLIVGPRYGSVDSASGLSYTQREFREAREASIHVLAFELRDESKAAQAGDEHEKKLTAFRDEVRAHCTISKLADPTTLPEQALASLKHFAAEEWIRKTGQFRRDSPQSAPSSFKASAELASRIEALSTELANHPLAGRDAELDQLEQFLKRPSGFLLVTGDAGYGKSALLAHWLNRQHTQRRVVRHLFSCRSDLTRSVLEFYRSTLVTLSVHWNQPLLQLPASEGDAREALFALLEKVRTSEAGKTSPLLLVVDGLDEAVPAERWDYPFFPKALPEGMHIVVSVRLSDVEQVPAYLAGWLAQSDQRLPVGLLNRPALVDWMQRLGGVTAELANDESAVNALLQKTSGLPLHLAFIFDDLAKLPASREDFTKVIEQTPTGFGAYVDLQFRRLVESPVGKERRWREFFGLLVAARAELQRVDINAMLGLTIWDLSELPAELHRWVSQHGDGYAFRNEALRLAFARLNPWPDARKRLLEYSRDWNRHRQPYAFRSLIGHLRDAGDKIGWFATATDREFLKCQGEAFPYEPLMPLQTIEEAMTEAMACGDLQPLCRLMFVHAAWMPDPRKINPLEYALSSPSMVWQQIKLAETTDPSTEAMWQVLVAWRCAVERRTDDARRFLSQVATSAGRSLGVTYWGQILGMILPQLMEVDAALTVNVALALLDTAELPRFLVATRPPAEAISLTKKWYATGTSTAATGWLTLWRSMAEKGELAAILNTTRSLQPEHRASALWEVSLILARLGRLNQLQECLAEIEQHPGTMVENLDVMAKTRVVMLASIGSLRLQSGDDDGRNMLLEAEAAADTMPPTLPHQAETLARVGEAWAQAGAVEAAESVFARAVELTRAATAAHEVKAGTFVEIARSLWSAYRSCPGLKQCAIDLLQLMEQLADGPLSKELKNNLRRTVADGWDELGDVDRALEWIREIPNPQFHGKAIGDLVERRLREGKLQEAQDLIKEKRCRHPGWGLVHLGAYHVRRQEWDTAATAFARAVQSGATHGGKLNSMHTSVLLAELACVFDRVNESALAAQHLQAAIQRLKMFKGHFVWWNLLDVAERTFWLQSTNLGARALEEATVGALRVKNDPGRVPLLCFVARVQHLVARQPGRAQEALDHAMDIIKNYISDPVEGIIARCEIAEALHRCGLDEQANQHLRRILAFAERRTIRPPDKADKVVAEAALGHARCANLSGAKRLLALIGDCRLQAANRARAIIYTYDGDDDASEAAVSRIGNHNFSAKVRRDLAKILIKLKRVEQALVVARRIQVDRDNALPWIAMAFVEGGFRDAFFKLIIPATRFPNATSVMLAGLLRLHPELAPDMSSLLVQFVPNVLAAQSESD
jgi:hypothetical protein